MKEKLQQFDKGLARGEAAVATVVLLLLVLVAALQSFFRNMADLGLSWGADALSSMAWGDAFMEKATLWVAMFGASLATHYNKHIAIDVVGRLSGPRLRAVMQGVVLTFAGVTCFYFARVVLAALLAKAARIPAEYGVFGADGSTVHICLGSPEAIADAGYERPDLFCALRSFLEWMGLTVNTPERAMDLVVPAMFCVIGLRFVLKGLDAFARIPSGGIPDEELEGGLADLGDLDDEGASADELARSARSEEGV